MLDSCSKYRRRTDVVVGKHLLDHVDDGHVLEDARVLVDREEPDVRDNVDPVVVVLVITAARFETADDAVDVAPRPAVVGKDTDRDLCADDALGVDGLVYFCDQLHLVVEELGDAFRSGEELRQKYIRASVVVKLRIGLSVKLPYAFATAFVELTRDRKRFTVAQGLSYHS